mmetsp:Transcript_19271/g.25387  ORF Transcript_19271/g.25387 Transcript_19271/m.25387 type:complete len:536 (+) Transcript_19271:67-1674(+)
MKITLSSAIVCISSISSVSCDNTCLSQASYSKTEKQIQHCLEFEHGVGIGDRVASEISSRQFFENVDENGDGKLEQDEIREYVGELHLEDSLGAEGPWDLERELATAFENLDADADQSLSQKDVRAFWASLGSLLSVSEVADWVVHGLGLPQEVGETFLLNAVTGYDFPELVANRGLLLEEELGITRLGYRSRILRAIKLRMLGVGDPPAAPGPVVAERLAPQKVQVQWGTESHSSEFPIHKYRLQRRAHNRQEASDKNGIWITVMDGLYTMYTDSKLEPSIDYVYRVQAWNLMGHSDFVYVTVQTLPESYNFHATFQQLQMFFEWLSWIMQCLTSSLHYMFTFLAIFGAYLRLQRTTAYRRIHSQDSRIPPAAAPSFFSSVMSNILQWILGALVPSRPPALTAQRNPRFLENNVLTDNAGTHHLILPQQESFESINTFNSNRYFPKQRFRRRSSEDSHKYCFLCQKKFRRIRLKRHFCSQCSNVFCHRHGKVAHSRLKSCQISRNCVCAQCLWEDSNPQRFTDHTLNDINDIHY